MLAILLLVLQLSWQVIATPNFQECLNKLQSGGFGSSMEGAVDTNGNTVSNVSQVVGLMYQACNALCGSGPEAFDGLVFSQQLAAWLLPWLALLSQHPYRCSEGL
jgi:hypothetical protein